MTFVYIIGIDRSVHLFKTRHQYCVRLRLVSTFILSRIYGYNFIFVSIVPP